MPTKYQFLIIGCGIMGLSIARVLRQKYPDAAILILDKEKEEAFHASSRNSGVLHAGFYYSADSFKAKFTVAGNQQLKDYCLSRNIPVNQWNRAITAGTPCVFARFHFLNIRTILGTIRF